MQADGSGADPCLKSAAKPNTNLYVQSLLLLQTDRRRSSTDTVATSFTSCDLRRHGNYHCYSHEHFFDPGFANFLARLTFQTASHSVHAFS